jgi:hypothetical protein
MHHAVAEEFENANITFHKITFNVILFFLNK